MATIATGLGFNGAYPTNLVALDRRAVGIFNGYDANQFYWLPTGTLKGLGIAVPGAAPTLSSQASGALTGAFRYRVRWADSDTNTVSSPSAELSVTSSSQKNTVARPSNSGIATRITHWVLERTCNNGQVFYPVNTTTAAPYGTAIGTSTYQDNTADNDAFTFAATYSDYSGLVRPYPLACMNAGRLFVGGATTHIAQATLANSSTGITGGSGFTPDMVGATVLVVGDTTFEQLVISAYVSASALTLGAAWSGSTATYTLHITLAPNRIAWSEANSYEYFGTAVVSGLSNEAYVGSNGEAITAIAGFGAIAGTNHVLYAKRSRLYLHSYTTDPSYTQGGTLHELPARRGALGSRSLFVHEGVAYGIDDTGIWRYVPNGVVENISDPIAGDWRSKRWLLTTNDTLNTNTNGKYWIEWRPEINCLCFWMIEAYQANVISTLVSGYKPSLGYLWDLKAQAFVGSVGPLGDTLRLLCGDVVPDSLGQLRACAYTEYAQAPSAACYAHEIGDGDGVVPSTNLVHTIASVSAAGQYVQLTGTPLTASALIGIPILVRSATLDSSGNNTETLYVCTSNTNSRVYLAPWSAPSANDILYPGPVRWKARTMRLDAGEPLRVKSWVSLHVRKRSKATASSFYAKIYHVGYATEQTPGIDRLAIDQTGITQATAGSTITIGETGIGSGFGWTGLRVPLNKITGYDVQFDFFGFYGGSLPEIVPSMQLIALVDDAEMPSQKTDVNTGAY